MNDGNDYSLRSPSGGERLYRLLLLAYPREFRRAFGQELLETFRDARRDADGRGTPRVEFWTTAVLDILSHASAERIGSLWRTLARVKRHQRRTPTLASTPPRRGGGAIQSFASELKVSFRSLSRRPALTASMFLTLGIGIGATSAIFSIVDAVLLRPLPVRDAGQLVALAERRAEGVAQSAVSYAEYLDLREGLRSMSGLAVYSGRDVSARVGDRAEMLLVELVSGNYFDVLGIEPGLGRTIGRSDEGAPGEHAVAVLSHAFWHRVYGGDPTVIGRALVMQGNPFTIVGVSPPSFRGVELRSSPDVWVPVTTSHLIGAAMFARHDALAARPLRWLTAVGRLAPGTDRSRAESDLTLLKARIASAHPEAGLSMPGREEPGRIELLPVTEAAAISSHAELVRFLRILLGVVSLTLLIACVNIANLLLVRAAERRREMGLRAALGAGRGRLARELLLESMVLALGGAALGAAVAAGALALLERFALPGGIELATLGLTLDARMLAFTAIVAVATVLLFGVVPAWRGSSADPAIALQGGTAVPLLAGMRAPRILAPGMPLISVQTALSLILLIGAGLFIRSLRHGLETDLGFDARGVAAVSFSVGRAGYDDDRAQAFYVELLERSRALPGVSAAAIAHHVPLAPRRIALPVSSPGASEGTGGGSGMIGVNPVTAEYFRVLGMPIVEGRPFQQTDQPGGARVAIVNEALARELWPGRSALGQSVQLFPGTDDVATVVGVVQDARYVTVQEEGRPYLYLMLPQYLSIDGTGTVHLAVRGDGDAATLLASLQRLVRDMDSDLPQRNPRVVAQQIDKVLMPQRFGVTLLGAFSVFSLALSAIGIYGVVAYTVSRSTRELGVRVALGAARGHIVQVVTGRSATALAIGILLGLMGAAAATRLLQVFLLGVRPMDPVTFVGAALVIVMMASLAALLPVRRAARVDPVITMRAN